MAENDSSSTRQERSDKASPGAASGDERRVWTTEELLGGGREVLIRHGEDVYRLRITRHGKLILYK
jgi:hemin uptake protein HemP